MKVIETIYTDTDDIVLQLDSLTRISLKDFVAKIVAEAKDEMAQDIENLTNANNYYFKTLDEIEELCKLSLHCDTCYEISQKIKEIKDILEVKD